MVPALPLCPPSPVLLSPQRSCYGGASQWATPTVERIDCLIRPAAEAYSSGQQARSDMRLGLAALSIRRPSLQEMNDAACTARYAPVSFGPLPSRRVAMQQPSACEGRNPLKLCRRAGPNHELVSRTEHGPVACADLAEQGWSVDCEAFRVRRHDPKPRPAKLCPTVKANAGSLKGTYFYILSAEIAVALDTPLSLQPPSTLQWHKSMPGSLPFLYLIQPPILFTRHT